VSIASLDLNLLLVLDTVLREKSVARAAKRLHVTPSAISNGLAKLRVALGDPLVTRQGRGIVPTPRAVELAPVLGRAMAELERMIVQGPFDAASCTRSFTLAMADAGQVAWLPSIASAVSRTMPNASLRVVGIESLLALGDLGSGEIDVHIGVPAKGPQIHSEPLHDEPAILVARSGNRTCAGKLTPRRLALLRHVRVDMAPGRGFRDALAATYARADIPRTVAITVPSFAAAAAVVASTDLVATLPQSLFSAQGSRLGLMAVAGAVPRHTVAIALCWHERTHADPAMAAFRALLRAALGPAR
jgi:DNA-binding transcriptional LysR family regulator